MDFGDAIKELRAGKKASRVGWVGVEGWIVYVDGAECDPMNGDDEERPRFYFMVSPFILMVTAYKQFTPYTPTQADMLADDWLIAESATIAGL